MEHISIPTILVPDVANLLARKYEELTAKNRTLEAKKSGLEFTIDEMQKRLEEQRSRILYLQQYQPKEEDDF